MEAAVASDPKQGAVIRGSGGVRKVRFAYGRAGKSGGGRMIYYFLAPSEAIYLIDAYAKVDQADISADDIKAYHAMLKDLPDE